MKEVKEVTREEYSPFYMSHTNSWEDRNGTMNNLPG